MEAWKDIKETGILGGEQLRAYECLVMHGPLTGREIDDKLGVDMHKRLSELERYGVVSSVGKRCCQITGRFVHEWDVTPGPIKRQPRAAKPKRAKRKSLVALLEEACEALEASGDLFAVAKAREIRARIGGDS